jgi:hypothetical protein
MSFGESWTMVQWVQIHPTQIQKKMIAILTMNSMRQYPTRHHKIFLFQLPEPRYREKLFD